MNSQNTLDLNIDTKNEIEFERFSNTISIKSIKDPENLPDVKPSNLLSTN